MIPSNNTLSELAGQCSSALCPGPHAQRGHKRPNGNAWRLAIKNVIYEGTPHGSVKLAQPEFFSYTKFNFNPHYRGIARLLLWPTRTSQLAEIR